MDGARFANALVHLGVSPAEMTWKAGIDILSFGATQERLHRGRGARLLRPGHGEGDALSPAARRPALLQVALHRGAVRRLFSRRPVARSSRATPMRWPTACARASQNPCVAARPGRPKGTRFSWSLRAPMRSVSVPRAHSSISWPEPHGAAIGLARGRSDLPARHVLRHPAGRRGSLHRRTRRLKRKRPGEPGRKFRMRPRGRQAALASICFAFAPPIEILRGFIASGISRTSSMWSRPFSRLAPVTSTWSASWKRRSKARAAMPR